MKRILKETTHKKYIFFRNDDVAGLNENLVKLVDIFILQGVPVHLSVIPDQLTEDCKEFLVKKLEKYSDLIEIGQHGFSHKNYSESNDKFGKYEFGGGRSYGQQSDDIIKGNKILRKYFKRKIDVFTPPWHGFDETTLKILVENKFSAISLDHRKMRFDNYEELKNIPVSIDFNKRCDAGGWFVENNNKIMKKLAWARNSRTGILLHHSVFNDQREFDQLDELLRLLKSDECVEFISLTRSPQLDTNENVIYSDVLAYYLNYQFVPKPLVIMRNSKNPACRKYDFNYHDSPRPFQKREDAISANLYQRLKEVIKQQLPKAEKPVGLLLSGGFDSAAILHILREVTSRKIYTLAGAYCKDAKNLVWAKRLAKRYNTTHQNLIMNPESLKKIDELYRHTISQPMGDNGFLATYLMIKKLKENAKHIFSGDGADCVFCGLKMHHLNLTEKKEKSVYEHYKFGEIFLDKEELQMLFGKKTNNIKLEAPLEYITRQIRTVNPIKRQILLDLNFLVRNRVDYILQAARANGLDINLPYLDKEFVDFALRIPPEYLISGSHQQKYILKKTFENKLPRGVLEGEKEGLTPPFKLWYYKNKDFIAQKLIKSKKIGISTKYIKYLIYNIKNSNNYEMGMKIWLLLNLASWYDMHFETKKRKTCLKHHKK